MIQTMFFVIATGDDDLRSDSDVSVAISYNDGRGTMTADLSQGAGWPNGSTHYMAVQLLANTHASDIDGVEIRFKQGGGGWNGDNWNMQGLELWVEIADGGWAKVYGGWGDPLQRFTGKVTTFDVPFVVAPAAATAPTIAHTLTVTRQTGLPPGLSSSLPDSSKQGPRAQTAPPLRGPNGPPVASL
jgi:hypothetical protein